MDKKIPIILCIDVEPDGFFIDKTKLLPWRGFEALHQLFNSFRKPIKEATGEKAHFLWSYSLDPQVEKTYGSAAWPLTHYSQITADLETQGDELGLHPHAYRSLPQKNNWIEDRADQNWVNHCTQIGFDAYKQVLKRTCRVFRFGSVWINNETLNLAHHLGAEIDLTLEPGFKPEGLYKGDGYLGETPNFDHVPRMPYQKADHDYSQKASVKNGNLWMIPLTGGKVSYRYGRLETFTRKIFSPVSVEPFHVTLKLSTNPRYFIQIVEEHLDKKPAYIAMSLRSDAGISKKHLNYISENLNYLISHSRAKQFVLTTPHEALKIMGYKD